MQFKQSILLTLAVYLSGAFVAAQDIGDGNPCGLSDQCVSGCCAESTLPVVGGAPGLCATAGDGAACL